MLHKVLEIKNKDGLRARPAAMFVLVAGHYTAQLLIEKGSKMINAKSIMGVLSLGIQCGESIHLVADGDDEAAAVDALSALIDSDFEEV